MECEDLHKVQKAMTTWKPLANNLLNILAPSIQKFAVYDVSGRVCLAWVWFILSFTHSFSNSKTFTLQRNNNLFNRVKLSIQNDLIRQIIANLITAILCCCCCLKGILKSILCFANGISKFAERGFALWFCAEARTFRYISIKCV